MADYRSQAERPFEHEKQLKELLARQSELNSLLDLDKGDQQGADSEPDLKDAPTLEAAVLSAPPGHDGVAKMAEAYMRAAGSAIREMPIIQREPPERGCLTGRAVAKHEGHLAIATAPNSFVVVDATSLGRIVQIGQRLSLRFQQGRVSIDNGPDRSR